MRVREIEGTFAQLDKAESSSILAGNSTRAWLRSCFFSISEREADCKITRKKKIKEKKKKYCGKGCQRCRQVCSKVQSRQAGEGGSLWDTYLEDVFTFQLTGFQQENGVKYTYYLV